MNTQEMIETIRSNYPPENYSMLREALDHCLTLLKADAEGRLVVLPETVYQHDAERIYESRVRRVIYETDAGFAFDDRAVGKTVFLTREEAEAALKEEPRDE